MTATTGLHARPGRVLHALLYQAQVLLAVVLPPMVVALATAQWSLALSLAPQAVVLAAISVAMRRRQFPDDFRMIEALVVFALIFLIASALVAPAFAVLGMPLLDAMFEAVSGVTSTGLTVAQEAENWPVAAHLMRGWIQWCGGFAIAFAGLALLSGTSGAALSMGNSSFARRDNLVSMRAQARQVLIAYCALSAVAIAACILVIPNWWEATSVALAAVSTGGFSPRADSLASYSAAAQLTVIAICIAAALSLMFYVQILRDGFRAALTETRVAATLGLMAGMTMIGVMVTLILSQDGAGSPFDTALNLLSGFSTAGFSTASVSGHSALIPLFLVAMVIGGDIGSTGGGIKVGRVILLAHALQLSIARAGVPPTAVTYLRDGEQRVSFDSMVAVLSLLLLYLISLVLCWGVFLLSGAPPLPSLFEVVSALSTVGLSQGITGADLDPHLKVTLMVAMLLGRLEFIALIVLCLPGTWWKRS